jgi:hypothetical protein
MAFLNNLKELFPFPNVAVVFGAANVQPFLTLPNISKKFFNFFSLIYLAFLVTPLKELWGCKSSIVIIQGNTFFTFFLNMYLNN